MAKYYYSTSMYPVYVCMYVCTCNTIQTTHILTYIDPPFAYAPGVLIVHSPHPLGSAELERIYELGMNNIRGFWATPKPAKDLFAQQCTSSIPVDA